jgi:hypothetical protein
LRLVDDQGLGGGRRLIAAAIIDHQHLPGPGLGAQEAQDLLDGRWQATLFVVSGDDQREKWWVRQNWLLQLSAAPPVRSCPRPRR